MNDDLREQMTALTNQMKHFHASLEVKARDMEMAGGDAEVVSAMVLIQLAYPGAPVFHSIEVSLMHPRTGGYVTGVE